MLILESASAVRVCSCHVLEELFFSFSHSGAFRKKKCCISEYACGVWRRLSRQDAAYAVAYAVEYADAYVVEYAQAYTAAILAQPAIFESSLAKEPSEV